MAVPQYDTTAVIASSHIHLFHTHDVANCLFVGDLYVGPIVAGELSRFAIEVPVMSDSYTSWLLQFVFVCVCVCMFVFVLVFVFVFAFAFVCVSFAVACSSTVGVVVTALSVYSNGIYICCVVCSLVFCSIVKSYMCIHSMVCVTVVVYQCIDGICNSCCGVIVLIYDIYIHCI